MHKVIFMFIGLHLFYSCDQFNEEVKSKGQVFKKKPQKVIKTDCSQLMRFGDSILKVKSKVNGVTKNVMSGFEIIKAKNCPTVRLSEGDKKVEFVGELKRKKSSHKCELVDNKIICPKSN